MPWETNGSSERRLSLPANWDQLRRETRDAAGGMCQWPRSSGRLCGQPGTDCDHIGDPSDHSFANRRWLCRFHHNMHTSQQSAEARRAIQAKVMHPVEKHPGLR
jgi:5-methylcytosine-specific restriction protein A